MQFSPIIESVPDVNVKCEQGFRVARDTVNQYLPISEVFICKLSMITTSRLWMGINLSESGSLFVPSYDTPRRICNNKVSNKLVEQDLIGLSQEILSNLPA